MPLEGVFLKIGSTVFRSPIALSSEITMVCVLDPPLMLDTTDEVELSFPSCLRSLLLDLRFFI